MSKNSVKNNQLPLPSRSMGNGIKDANRSQSTSGSASFKARRQATVLSSNQPRKVALAKKSAGQKANLQVSRLSSLPTTLKLNSSVTNGKGGTSKATEKRGKREQINDPEAMDKRLKTKSPWYASLRDPIKGAGARIPDIVGIATATLQTVQVVSFATNAQGINGLFLRSPLVANASATNPIYPVPSTATAAALTWDTTNNIGLSIAPTVRAVAQGHRVVSAAVYAEYEGSTLNDQGDVTSFIGPWSDLLGGWGAGNSTQTLAAAQAEYGSVTVPVNKARSRPVSAMYFPVNMEDMNYDSFWNPLFATYGQSSLTAEPCWGLGHVFAGLATGTTVKYTIVINYEFVPLLNTQDYIAADPSPVDPMEEQLVEQWVQEDSWTGLSENKKVDVTPGAQVVEAADQGMNADSGFGMLGSIITELLPVALTLL